MLCSTAITIITLGAKGHGERWAGNTHRFVLKEETAQAFIGWTEANYQRDPAMEPCVFPKYAWEEKRVIQSLERNRKARANRKARREVMESIGLKSYRVNGREVWE